MRRKVFHGLVTCISAAALFLIMSGPSCATIIKTDDFLLTGKVEAKAAFFTGGWEGNSYPHFSAWDMFKERNLAYLQVDHDLKTLTGMNLQYHLVGRAMYEGVYDYGPSIYRSAYDNNKAAFDRYNLRAQAALWEAYANLKTGPVNIRIGRQNLSWGQMDILRVVDHINPLDNTWGGTGTESLDDRRIPLWMVRVTYQKDPSFGIEGFLVPGAIDNTVGPQVPWGSPYGGPVHAMDGLAALGMYTGFNNSYGAITEPDRDMGSSRVGLKIMTNLLDSNFALTFQRTYPDTPALRFSTNGGILGHDPIGIGAGNPGTLAVEFQYPKVNIFGLEGSHYFEDIDLIVKGEIAHTQGAAVYIPAINQPMGFAVIPGIGAVPVTVGTGVFTYRDETDFGISLEKQFWMRAINKGNRISFMFEYYGMYIHGWDERIIFGGVPDPATDINPQRKQYESILCLVASSNWYSKWNLSNALFYDVRGAWMFSPTLSYKFNNPLTLQIAYSAAWGQWQTFAFMRDRDQVNILARYEF